MEEWTVIPGNLSLADLLQYVLHVSPFPLTSGQVSAQTLWCIYHWTPWAWWTTAASRPATSTTWAKVGASPQGAASTASMSFSVSARTRTPCSVLLGPPDPTKWTSRAWWSPMGSCRNPHHTRPTAGTWCLWGTAAQSSSSTTVSQAEAEEDVDFHSDKAEFFIGQLLVSIQILVNAPEYWSYRGPSGPGKPGEM